MTTYNVSDSAGLNSIMGSAVAGDKIVLGDGNYDLYYNATVANYGAAKITLEAQNVWGAVINNAETLNGSNVIFNGIDFTDATYPQGSQLEFLFCRLGYVRWRGASDCTVKYSFIHGFQQIEQTANNRITYDCNLFREIDNQVNSNDWDDWIQIQGGDGHVIIRNTFWDRWIAYVSGNSGEYRHTDHIQIMDEAGNVTNITVHDNWLYDSGATQQAGATGLWVIMINCNAQGASIMGNIVCGASANGVFVRDNDGNSVVSENLVIPGPSGVVGGGNPIRLKTGGSTAITVEDNVVGSIMNEVGASANVSGNVTGITGAGDLDWTYGGTQITDYVPSPGGAADVPGRWRTRLDAIIAGTQDFYAPDGTLYLASGGDVITPVVSSASTNETGDEITVVLSEGMDLSNDTTASEWAVVAAAAGVTITSASLATATTVVLELASPVLYGQTITFDYTGTSLRDDSSNGNLLDTFSGVTVVNNVPEPAEAPTPSVPNDRQISLAVTLT